MTNYSVILIGLGNIGMMYDVEYQQIDKVLTHARAFSQHKSFTICCAVDTSSEARSLFTHRYGCQSYSSIEEALEYHYPQIAVIATPTESHLGISKQLLSHIALKAILCEKPLAYSLDEAKELVELCQIRECALYVNYMRRVDPAVLRIKNMISSNQFSPPIKGFCFYSKGLFHNGSHFFNLLEFWLGSYQSHIVCNEGRKWADQDYEPDVYVEFSKGSIVFQAAWEEEFSHYTIELLSKCGRIRYDHGGYHIEHNAVDQDPDYPEYRIVGRNKMILANQMSRCQLTVVDSLSDALSGEESFLCTGSQALKTLQSLHQIITSLANYEKI